MLTLTLVNDLTDHPAYTGEEVLQWQLNGDSRGLEMDGLFVVTSWASGQVTGTPSMATLAVEEDGEPILVVPPLWFGPLATADHRKALEEADLITSMHEEVYDETGRIAAFVPPAATEDDLIAPVEDNINPCTGEPY